MKKTYIMPAMHCVAILSTSIMAGSEKLNVYQDDPDGVSNEQDVLSRRRSLWDDDEE